LPRKNDYGTLKELKALLWNHFETVTSSEKQSIIQLAKYQKHSSEVVNIYFGLTDYGRMKYLIKIY